VIIEQHRKGKLNLRAMLATYEADAAGDETPPRPAAPASSGRNRQLQDQ
jgi:hypothetical protein